MVAALLAFSSDMNGAGIVHLHRGHSACLAITAAAGFIAYYTEISLFVQFLEIFSSPVLITQAAEILLVLEVEIDVSPETRKTVRFPWKPSTPRN